MHFGTPEGFKQITGGGTAWDHSQVQITSSREKESSSVFFFFASHREEGPKKKSPVEFPMVRRSLEHQLTFDISTPMKRSASRPGRITTSYVL